MFPGPCVDPPLVPVGLVTGVVPLLERQCLGYGRRSHRRQFLVTELFEEGCMEGRPEQGTESRFVRGALGHILQLGHGRIGN
ncbi:hypothetical protein D3C87_1585580 [compost metagenome]